MGFIVMVSAAIIGILLLVAGIKNIKKNWLWLPRHHRRRLFHRIRHLPWLAPLTPSDIESRKPTVAGLVPNSLNSANLIAELLIHPVE